MSTCPLLTQAELRLPAFPVAQFETGHGQGVGYPQFKLVSNSNSLNCCQECTLKRKVQCVGQSWEAASNSSCGAI